ncbi:MAG: hypothetical protein ACM3MK_05060 [Chitinophagales bacterium]
MEKMVLKNALVLKGKASDLRLELQRLSSQETLKDYLRRNLN